MRGCVLWAVLTILLAGCSGEKKTSDDVVKFDSADGPALSVGSELLTRREFFETMVENSGGFMPLVEYFRPKAAEANLPTFKLQAGDELKQMLNKRVTRMLLYQQAKRELKDRPIDEILERIANDEVKKFILNDFQGDKAKAEQSLKDRKMTWESFMDGQKKMAINQWYVETYMPKTAPVTTEDILERYNQIKVERYSAKPAIKFELLEIKVLLVQPADANEYPLAAALRLAADLVGQVRRGTDMAQLAADHNAVSYDASYRDQSVNPGSLGKPYDILAAAADKLEIGRISEPIVTSDARFIFVMKLDDKRTASIEPVEQVQREIEQMIIAERRTQALARLEADFEKQALLIENEAFLDAALDQLYLLCRR